MKNKSFTRPKYKGSTITTPSVVLSMELLGGESYKNIVFSTDQFRAIKNLYGFVPEKTNKKPDPPAPPNKEDFDFGWEYKDAQIKYERELEHYDKWEDPKALLQAGSDRNAMRYAESDGLRIIAWLAKYLQAGEDPLKNVVQLFIANGLDVSYEDVEWSETIDE